LLVISALEFEGKTEKEAASRACSTLRVGEHELDYTVVDEGMDGPFGLGSRPVRIRVRSPSSEADDKTASRTKRGTVERVAEDRVETTGQMDAEDEEARGGVIGPAPEKAARALEVANGLAERMGLEAHIEVRDENERIVIVINEREGMNAVAEMLGNSRPPAIPSFQFLLNKIVNRFPEGRKHILVEVPSVPRRTQERKPRPPAQPREPDPDLDPTLVQVGRLLAERAVQLGKVITVHPMLPGDRRAVHQTIMTMEGVHTMSEGEGLYRRMHVVPDALKGGTGGGGRRRRRRRRRRRGEGAGEAPGADRDLGGDSGGDSDQPDGAP
jgi:spoIIIJ-associated protein